jgi:hypothetical protein
VTEWYQSYVARSNTSIVRRVIFYWLFSTKSIFAPSLFKTSSLLLIMSTLLLFLAPMIWKKFLLTFSKASQKFWHLQVYIFVSKHFNEVWRYNEGHVKDEALLSSRLEDIFGWRDGRVTPSSTLRRMTIRAPPVYVIPTMMVTRSSRSWIGVFSV